MTPRIRVLAVDGGGIRGLIPVRLMVEMEQRTGRPLSDLFDVVAASSVGAIISLMLFRPGFDGAPAFTAREVLALFQREVGRIFPRKWWHGVPLAGFVGNMLRPKYAPDGLEEVLREVLEDIPLGASRTRLVIPAYDIERGEPRLFRSWDPADADLPMRTVARAATAAPGLLPPARVEDPPGAYLDGALFADNGGIQGYLEARRMMGDADVVVVSLGTGRVPVRAPHDTSHRWGFFMWGPRIVAVALDGASRMVDSHMEALLPEGPDGRRLFRFQPVLDPSRWSLDDIRPANQNALISVAEEMIRGQEDALQEACRLLTEAAERGD